MESGVFNLLTYACPSPGPLSSPAMELTGEDGREVWKADGDLTGAGEGDLSNSSSWWDDSSSDGRCGGVGLGGAFFLEEDFLQASWETSFLCLDHDLCQPSGEYDEIEAKGWFQYIIMQ